MSNKIISFLRSREVPESVLDKLRIDKVDEETVLGIDDPTLAKYIEKLGDRVALRNFCASSQQSLKKKNTRQLAISNVQILDDFYAFIAVQDKEIFQSALVDFSSVDYEDVIEALNTHDCRTRIKESNLLAVLLEIADKEIIQTPTFVSDCWRDILQELCIAKEKLDNIYAKLIPSNKGVDFVNEHGNEVCKFLKRYVKELDNRKLRLFLRYCTGSDLLNVDKIAVELVPMTDFE
ncbi:UNVERIFIED_CONTAM: hypothetical protein FKN15_073610 [Acipenser sinensis]